MKTIFPIKLSCGTEMYLTDIWIRTFAECPVHHMPDTIDAIETREWYVKCHTCRFARWAGMSHPNARIIERKHLVSKPGHKLSIDFIVPDDVREKWRQVFGRKRYPARFIGTNRISITIREESQPIRHIPIPDKDPAGQNPPF